ncbi:MAG: YaiI/YqxD family protein [Alphaproteobacteria bacterium]|nr:YaiI/YqxD family protein [Alphaproteobacteria bacterium]
MQDIYIDADACPVKEEIIKVGNRHNLKIYMVSNSGLRRFPGPNIQHIVVSDNADAADNWIVEHIQENDIFITSDILLADRCVKKNAKGLDPTGRQFTSGNIGSTVAMRNLSAHLREIGAISGYNKSFSKKDKSTFLRTLEEIIQSIKRSI